MNNPMNNPICPLCNNTKKLQSYTGELVECPCSIYEHIGATYLLGKH